MHVPPNPLPHITDWLFEIGPSSANGMGESPIDWASIAAWSGQIGIVLNAWEARTIRRLSQDFIHMRFEARKASCPAPFDPDADDEAKGDDRVTAQFRAMMAAFAPPPMPHSVDQQPKA